MTNLLFLSLFSPCTFPPMSGSLSLLLHALTLCQIWLKGGWSQTRGIAKWRFDFSFLAAKMGKKQ